MFSDFEEISSMTSFENSPTSATKLVIGDSPINKIIYSTRILIQKSNEKYCLGFA